jgi:hypothetical protein
VLGAYCESLMSPEVHPASFSEHSTQTPSPAISMENLKKGLSSAEARRILARVGPNATPDVAVHPLRLVLSKFLAPVSVLLEIAIVLQLMLGEYVEGSIIAAPLSASHWDCSISPSASVS